MNKTNSILAVLTGLTGIGVAWLYQQNTALHAQIRSNAEQCEQQIATLDRRYRDEVEDLRKYLLEQYQNPANEAAVKARKPRFNQLISAGHRMQAVGRKYEFLLGSALLDAEGKKQLQGLLYKWEKLKDAGGAPGELEATETRIRQLLVDPMDYQQFLIQRQRDL